jgi:hypothetical protein
MSMQIQKMLLMGIMAVLLLVSTSLAGVLVWSSQSGPPTQATFAQFGPIDVQDRTALEGNTGMIIPQSAGGIHGVINGSQKITTYMRFDIPASDLSEALKNTGCSTALNGTDDIRKQLQQYPKRDWWTPEKAQKYVSCNATHEYVVQEVFVDLTDPQRYIVYVVASTK